jgi:luciferase family oxidoreductase group 1
MRMAFPLGVLDQSPVLSGMTPADAIRATIALAKRAETLGYKRFWLAEHHAMRGLADASPEILLARLTAETSNIRLGTGGIMLPHYSAFKVAETFRMLETLAPGRIDLGVGRAPGGTRLVSAALESRDPATFPTQIADIEAFFAGTAPATGEFASLVAMPSGDSSPQIWMLGSSEYGALLAAEMGLPYTYAHFISGDAPDVTRAYRERYRPSLRHPVPRVIVALGALVAESDAEAERLALPVMLWRMLLLRGRSGPVPTLAEAEAYPWTQLERYEVARTRRLMTGRPSAVRTKIETLVAEHGADEVMIVTIAPDYATRERSYALLADAFAIGRRAA